MNFLALAAITFFLQSTSAAPAFHVTDLNGQVYDSASMPGKIVVLNFWFIGCEPCRAELPELNRLVSEFEDENVVFLGIAGNSRESLREFLATNPFAYSVIADESEVAAAFHVRSYPAHIVIDRQGRMRAELREPHELRTIIRGLLD